MDYLAILTQHGFTVVKNDTPKAGYKAVHCRKDGVNYYTETLAEMCYIHDLI